MFPEQSNLLNYLFALIDKFDKIPLVINGKVHVKSVTKLTFNVSINAEVIICDTYTTSHKYMPYLLIKKKKLHYHFNALLIITLNI